MLRVSLLTAMGSGGCPHSLPGASCGPRGFRFAKPLPCGGGARRTSPLVPHATAGPTQTNPATLYVVGTLTNVAPISVVISARPVATAPATTAASTVTIPGPAIAAVAAATAAAAAAAGRP